MHWIIVLLGLLMLALVSWSLLSTSPVLTQTLVNTNEPTYQSTHTTTMVYNSTGKLDYKLVADQVDYFSEQQITWLTKPVVTMFNERKLPTWTVKTDKAKLTQDGILFLYGHVQLDNLADVSQLKRVTTDNAIVNLVTHDFSSDDKVTLCGIGFSSTGMKMRGNLRYKTAKLIEKVKTSYEL